MGQLLSLLKGTGSEASLHSRLGRWRQRVSRLIDFLVSAQQQAHINLAMVVPQVIADLSTPTTVVFDNVADQNGEISYNPLDGSVQLEADTFYVAEAHLLGQVAVVATDFGRFHFEILVGGIWVPFQDVMYAEVYPMGAGGNVGSQPSVKVAFGTTSATRIRLVSDDGLGITGAVQTGSHMIVFKTGGT